VIGLGIMGGAMSTNLVRAGFEVHGFDIASSRRAALRRAGGKPAGSIAAVRSQVLITSLPSAGALHLVCQKIS
jgi:3-hydroxyisobutyrate dehydrogenase-like beta-hydroxyacid dehydrogenase